jgi:Ni/Fe-hydrogenase b-type cytochrome subunit
MNEKSNVVEEAPEYRGGELVKRHRASTRIWHWINAVAVIVMLMSGLMISNAHPHLYWGQYGANLDQPWFNPPQFPGWATIPSEYNLALARHWHLAFAWILALGLLGHMVISLVNRHAKDLRLSAKEIAPAHLWSDIKHHAQLKFPTGVEALKYNTLQKLTYIGVLGGLLPLLILTGMCLSPGLSSITGWAIDLFGGRASARSIHFICAGGIALFIVVHLTLVILAGPFNEVRSMITGKFRIPPPRADESAIAHTGEIA